MSAEKKLKELMVEFRSLKTETEKIAFDKKMSRLLAEMSTEERKTFRKAFLTSARQTVAEAKEIKKEAEMKVLLSGVDNYLSLSQIAQDYFGKAEAGFINGSTVRLSMVNQHSSHLRNSNGLQMP